MSDLVFCGCGHGIPKDKTIGDEIPELCLVCQAIKDIEYKEKKFPGWRPTMNRMDDFSWDECDGDPYCDYD